jgi:hypothetical protein
MELINSYLNTPEMIEDNSYHSVSKSSFNLDKSVLHSHSGLTQPSFLNYFQKNPQFPGCLNQQDSSSVIDPENAFIDDAIEKGGK